MLLILALILGVAIGYSAARIKAERERRQARRRTLELLVPSRADEERWQHLFDVVSGDTP